MSNNRFEDFLRDQLSYYPNDQGADNLWLGIEEELDRQNGNRKNRFFWLLFLGLLLLAVGLGLFFERKPSGEEAHSKNDVFATIIGIDDQVTATPSLEVNEPFVSVAVNSPKHLKEIDERLAQPAVVEPITTSLHKRPVLPPYPASEQRYRTNLSASRLSVSGDQVSAPIRSLDCSDKGQAGEIIKRNKKIQLLGELPSVTYSVEPKSNRVSLWLPPLADKKQQIDRIALDATTPLSNGYWAIQAEGGINWFRWEYQAREMGGESFANFRNEVESSLSGFQAGLSIRRVNAKGWSWKSGLYFQENWVKAAFQKNTLDSVLKENVVIRLLIDPRTNEVVDSVFGNATVARSRREIFVHHNAFRYFHIPLSVGYEWNTDRKLSFALEAGVGLNIWWRQRGIVLGENLERIELEKASTPELSTASLFISTQFSPIVRYRLSSNFAVFLRPTMDIFWSDWMDNNSLLSNRPIQMRANIGASYMF